MRSSVAALLAAIVVAACTPAPATPTDNPSPVAASPTPARTPEGTPAPTTWPLTGMPLNGDSAVRPIAVRFDNALPAQPQAGLNEADIIFDTVIEACVSRLLAVYHSRSPDTIGSIRSARLYDLQLLPLLRAALAHVGAADEVSQMLKDGAARGDFVDLDAYKFNNYPAYTSSYWRVAFKSSPYNMYSSIPNLRSALKGAPGGDASVTVPSWGFLPNEHEPTAGGFSNAVEAARFAFPGAGPEGCPRGQNIPGYRDEYAPTYTYEATARGYKRAANGRATIDETTKTPVVARNVIVIYSDLELTNIVESQGGWGVAYSIQPRTTGSGKLSVYREGRRVDGTWNRDSNSAPFDFRVSGGEKILLAPGQTWVHIVPTYWTVQ